MGAVTNMSPETFHAVIAQVPFVDVMNTMLDASLPLTTEEWIEWGNPNVKKDWDYMVQYSPYDNVKAQAYPNMLDRDLAQRQPGAVLGRCEVCRQDPRDEDGQQSDPAQNQHGRRPRRLFRPLRPAKRDRVRLRLRADRGRYHEIVLKI